MDRRTFLRWSAVASGVLVAGCAESSLSPPTAPPRTKTYGREEGTKSVSLSTRTDWLSGQFDGTQATLSDTLALGDRTVLEDDFGWSDPSESEFGWRLEEPSGSSVTPHSDEGYVELQTEATDEIVELIQEENLLNFDAHPDWRFNVTERNAQSTVGAAWEFWFNNPNDRVPWLLIDAGGGGNVESTESEDDSCGDGFYVRKDQLLTRYVEDGSPKWCWDEFAGAPIDHSVPRMLSMERLGSSGTVNAYVDGRFQANLQASEGQYILDGDDIGTAIRLHDRGDHAENGYVYHVSLQKVGVKRSRGSFTRTFRADRPVEWKRLELIAETPTDTTVRTRFRRPGDKRAWHLSLEDVPVSAAIAVEVTLETERPHETPWIHELTVSYDPA